MVEDRPAFMMNLRFPIGAVTDASLTIQGDNVADIAAKTIQAMTAFKDNIAQATAARSRSNSNGHGPQDTGETRTCSLHGSQMAKKQPKNGGGAAWWSHRDGNGWCKGKE